MKTVHQLIRDCPLLRQVDFHFYHNLKKLFTDILQKARSLIRLAQNLLLGVML